MQEEAGAASDGTMRIEQAEGTKKSKKYSCPKSFTMQTATLEIESQLCRPMIERPSGTAQAIGDEKSHLRNSGKKCQQRQGRTLVKHSESTRE